MAKPVKKRKAPNPNASGRKAKETPDQTDIADLIDIAGSQGAAKKRQCRHLKGGVCDFHTWHTSGEIPRGAGNPVQIREKKRFWCVEPTPLFCALCSWNSEHQSADEYFEEIYSLLEGLQRQMYEKKK